ncbi:MAG: hypothetical protein KGI50_00835 [Patescibacteria group bacterium]|nr:hypothetical protein [Patescibacteria group bacterium]MDE2438101.1 hypothetical protein [Patescibacteria group bacterium]
MNQKVIVSLVALILVSNFTVYELLHYEIQRSGRGEEASSQPVQEVKSLSVSLKEIKGNTLLVSVKKSSIGYSPVSYSDASITLTDATKIAMLDLSAASAHSSSQTAPSLPQPKTLSLSEFKALVKPGMELNVGSANDISKSSSFEASSIFFIK